VALALGAALVAALPDEPTQGDGTGTNFKPRAADAALDEAADIARTLLTGLNITQAEALALGNAYLRLHAHITPVRRHAG